MIVMGEIPFYGTPKELYSQVKITMAGRTSGETVKAPKGQIPEILGIISQAKGQSRTNAYNGVFTED
jgi:hypothetical protein